MTTDAPLASSGGSTPRHVSRVALTILVVGLLVRLSFAAILPLFPDEAYYWEWSRHLAAGYFDHPPGVALAIRFGTTVLGPFGIGDSPLAVRLGPVLAGFVASLATVGIGHRFGGGRSAVVAATVMTVLPLAAAGLVLATPDAPLLATAAVALYCVVRALGEAPRTAASLRWWALAGVALGLSFASKYTSIIVPLGVVVAAVARRELRPRLAEPGPWVAGMLATVVFLPVLVWNAHHAWISFAYQIEHGLARPSAGIVGAVLKREGDFIGGQAGLASPILFALMALAVWRALRSGPATAFMLALIVAIAFALFAYSALEKRVEPNWPSPAYIPAIALLSAHAWSPRLERWLKAGVWLAAIMSLVIYVQGLTNILPVRPARDPVARAFGWDALTVAVVNGRRELEQRTHSQAWVGGDRYQEAAEIAYHDPAHEQTFALNLTGRPNQYDLWPTFPQSAREGDDLVLALDDTPDPHPAALALAPYFQSMTQGALVELRRRRAVVGRRRLYLLVGWRGGWPVSAEPH